MSLRDIDPMTAYFAVTAIGGGFFALVWPGRAQARIEAAHQQRHDDRIARGSDAYFEELRSLQTYVPKSSLLRRRIVGGVFLALGLAYFFFIVFA